MEGDFVSPHNLENNDESDQDFGSNWHGDVYNMGVPIFLPGGGAMFNDGYTYYPEERYLITPDGERIDYTESTDE